MKKEEKEVRGSVKEPTWGGNEWVIDSNENRMLKQERETGEAIEQTKENEKETTVRMKNG